MRSGRFTSVLVAAAVVILNAIVFYSVYCTGDIVESTDVYGEEYSFSRSEEVRQNRIIAELPENGKEAVSFLEEHIARLTDYETAARFTANDKYAVESWDELSDEERTAKAERLWREYTSGTNNTDPEAALDIIRSDIELYRKVYEKVVSGENFEAYIDEVIENAEALSQIGIYHYDAFLLSNINKTRRDFYGLDGIDISVVSEAGAMTFIGCRFTDIFAVFLVLLTVFLIFSQDKSGAKSALYMHRSVFLPVITTLIGISVMYLSNYLLTVGFVGEIPFSALVQSMPSFRSCPYVISAGVFFVLSVLMKLLGCMVVFALSFIAMTTKGRKKAAFSAVIGGFVLLELLTAFSGLQNSVIAFLRENNLMSFFTFERFFTRYLNLNVFSHAVSRLPLFFVFAVMLFFISVSFAVRCFKDNSSRLVSEAEREYYDEINRRYTESRKIRHDIANHLLAVSALIEAGKTDEARRYIGEVSEANDLAAMPVRTGADVLDALLYKKTEQAKSNGVSLSIEVSCPLDNTSISDYDLCSVFGNILDNALEAAAPLGSDCKIDVLIGKQFDMLYIRCKNPYVGEIRTKGETLITKKVDAARHGYGIARVRDIAHRHGGDVKITAEDGVFLIEVLMNI